MRVDDGTVTPRVGHADEPDLLIHTSPTVLASIGAGEQSVVEALADGGLAAEGPPQAVEHCLAIFGAFWGAEGGASS